MRALAAVLLLLYPPTVASGLQLLCFHSKVERFRFWAGVKPSVAIEHLTYPQLSDSF